jgi:hypothetical protein
LSVTVSMLRAGWTFEGTVAVCLCLGSARTTAPKVRSNSRFAIRERGREEREDNNNIMCIPLRREPGPRVRLSGSVIKVRGLGMFYAGGPRAWWQR